MNSGERRVTQQFIDELRYFAETTGTRRLSPVIDRLRRPVRVAVTGRPGVGRATVVGALRRRGVAVVPSAGGEVCIRVIAEAATAEDLAATRSDDRPVLVILTKADLAGAGSGGPLAVAHRRARDLGALTGRPTVPAVGLLAALDADSFDEGLIAALQTFVTEPPDLSSVDAFVDRPHPVAPDVRARLLERLDRFGIAHAVLLLAGGAPPSTLTGRLAMLGNCSEVTSALAAVAAPVRYRRITHALAELHSLAAGSEDSDFKEGLVRMLTADSTVLAVMTAAVDVIEAEGLTVDRGDTPAAHLDRAVRWRRYGRGPVNALHRRCSDDVVRGSLRLLDAGT